MLVGRDLIVVLDGCALGLGLDVWIYELAMADTREFLSEVTTLVWDGTLHLWVTAVAIDELRLHAASAWIT